MANLEVINSSSTQCRKCGISYGRLKGYFPVNYSYLYKGIGYLPYCKQCVDDMYNAYFAECGNDHDAVRQMCRKLDVYWNESVFDTVSKLNAPRSMMTSYLAKINSVKHAGKSYDDTLKEEGVLWMWPSRYSSAASNKSQEETVAPGVSDEVIAFWGPGYTPKMYDELEERYHYWLSELDNPSPSIGVKASLRQIVSLEIDINRERAAGRSTEKLTKALLDALGAADLKPAQKDKSDATLENTPMGVWIKKWEEQRPLPEVDPELQDVDGIKKYISIWFTGHLAKSLGIKNIHSKLYEDEIAKLRVEKPEYESEDDDDLLSSVLGSDDIE